jgi:hypothetical protein
VGGILTWLLSKLPSPYKNVSVIAALITVIATIVMGVDDLKGGDLYDRAVGSDCAGWNSYVDAVDAYTSQYNRIIDEFNGPDLRPQRIRSIVEELAVMSTSLRQEKPPVAAQALHQSLLAVLMESETQLRGYGRGGTFNLTRLNQMLEEQGELIDASNTKCA